MATELTQELSDALQASDESGLEVVDPSTNRTYVIVEEETHRHAMEALRRQQDLESIQRGVEQADIGQGIPLEEADRQMRVRLEFPSREVE